MFLFFFISFANRFDAGLRVCKIQLNVFYLMEYLFRLVRVKSINFLHFAVVVSWSVCWFEMFYALELLNVYRSVVTFESSQEKRV